LAVRHQQASAMDEAQTFFREQFPKSKSASDYCQRRGLSQDVLEKWEIGYAPDVGDALATRLKKKQFILADCKALFLVDQGSDGGYYDKFRGRLMFPIRDEKGHLVAFGGRVLGDGTPKYINSSDTPLYRKSRVLYGMYVARETISKKRQTVLVEGYLDVIACHQAGVTNAVASLGTALSEDHAKLLSRWCDEVVILYDSDDAGRKAAERGVEVLRSESVKVRIALMPQGDDPDTLLKRDGAKAVQQAVDNALSPIEYKLQVLERTLKHENDEYWQEAVTILAEAASPAELDRHLAQLAPFYPWQRNTSRATATLRNQVMALRGVRGRKAPERPRTTVEHHSLKGELSSPEIVLLRSFLSEDLRPIAWKFAIAPDLFETPTGSRLSAALANAFSEAAPLGLSAAWLHLVDVEEAQQTLSDLTLDFRSENLSEAKLLDSVQRLSDVRDERKREELMRTGADRAKVFEMLKAKKIDTRAPKKDKDTLF
jgi:DNA primase